MQSIFRGKPILLTAQSFNVFILSVLSDLEGSGWEQRSLVDTSGCWVWTCGQVGGGEVATGSLLDNIYTQLFFFFPSIDSSNHQALSPIVGFRIGRQRSSGWLRTRRNGSGSFDLHHHPVTIQRCMTFSLVQLLYG